MMILNCRCRSLIVTGLSLSLLIGISTPSCGFDFNWVGGTGQWGDGSNWDQGGFIPSLEDEGVGVIGSDQPGTTQTGGVALISSAAPDSAGLVLGRDAGTNGTLRITSGGSINFLDSTGEPTGAANIGLAGKGRLEVQGGGLFSATLLDVNAGSMVEIGGGAGNASVVSTDATYLNGITITRGAGHTFSSAGPIYFESQSEYVVDLRGGSHTTLTTPNAIHNVQGRLSVQTSGGYVPTPGESWDLMTAAGIAGPGFVVDTSRMAAPPAGYEYRTQFVSGGSGQILQLVYDRYATLSVDANTGAISMASQSGTPMNIIGYSIVSNSGALNVSNWNSLSEQGKAGWEEAGTSSPNGVSELNAQGHLALGSSAKLLGNLFSLPQAFGDPVGDVEFEYAVEGASLATRGIVEFTGTAAANNLRLTVNPLTGEGQLQNSSRFSIDLAGYSILSSLGSLDASDWSSLESQSVSGWEVAAPTSTALSELVSQGVASLDPGEAFSLGPIFQVGAARDLALEFVLSVDGLEQIRQGIVQYGAIVEIGNVPGDYNSDGVVNAADYTVWRDNLGASSLPNEGAGISPGVVDAADYAYWKSRFGATSGAGAAAGTAAAASVPEVAGIVQLLIGFLVTAAGRCRSVRAVVRLGSE